MRLPATTRIGVGAITVAVIGLFYAMHWLNSRRMVLVDIPMQLSRGHIKTGQFEINHRALYSVLIQTGDGGSASCDENSMLQTRRLSFVGGQRVSGWDPGVAPPGQDVTFGPFLGAFDGRPGRFDLEIEVLADASCLDSKHPRLTIEASAADYNSRDEVYCLASLLALVIATVGVLLIIAGVSDSRRVRDGVYGSTQIYGRERPHS